MWGHSLGPHENILVSHTYINMTWWHRNLMLQCLQNTYSRSAIKGHCIIPMKWDRHDSHSLWNFDSLRYSCCICFRWIQKNHLIKIYISPSPPPRNGEGDRRTKMGLKFRKPLALHASTAQPNTEILLPFHLLPSQGSGAAYPFSFLRTSFQNSRSITAHSHTRNKMPFHAVNLFHLKCKLILASTEIKVGVLTLLDPSLIRICSKDYEIGVIWGGGRREAVGGGEASLQLNLWPSSMQALLSASQHLKGDGFFCKWPYRYFILCGVGGNDLPE